MSPDILLFISDQHAPQYQAGGQMPVDTPNLAALQEQGTAFDAAYTPCPLCVPARMAMLSGLSPYHTGIFTNNDTLPQTTPTFLHAMAAAGYETVLVGRMHFIGPDQRHGFTRRVAPDFTNSGWVRPQKTLEQDFGVHTQTMGYKWCIDVVGGGASPVVCYDDMVLDALEQYLAQPHSKPQLIVVGTYGPHFPYVAPPELFLKYLKTAQLPATWQGNEPWLNAQQRNLQEPNTRAEIVLACQAAYKGLVEHTDGLIGRARAAFDVFTQNRGTPALFGYFSDHGDTVGEHGIYGKKSFFEKSVRIPMVFAGSGVAAGQRITAPVSLLDLGPTVCDWAGADPLPEPDGQSLVAVLRGESADADRTVWSEIVDKLPQGGVLGQRVGRLRQLLMQREIFLLQGVQLGHVVPADNAVYPSQRGGPECRQLRQGQQKRGQHQRHGPAPTPPAAARKIQLHKHHPKAEYALQDGVRLWYNTERIQRM